jgi:CheY-like chemotaxis protein
MGTIEQSQHPMRTLEISASLAGRHFGLCGFDTDQADRISRVLGGANSLAVPFEERLLGKFAGACDAILIRLAGVSPEGLRTAAMSQTPILVTGPAEALLHGVGAAYSWPRDIMSESWSEAELLVRLFRLLQSPISFLAAATRETRIAPLVLLADDDQEVIALVEATLQSLGITCRTAEDGLKAVRLARELLPDLIILDIRMPKLDGFEVLETIRGDHRLQLLRVILLTGCDDPVDIVHGSDLGANDYIGKPVSPTVLLSRIKRLLGTHADGARQWTRSSPSDRASRWRTAQWIPTISPDSGGMEQR